MNCASKQTFVSDISPKAIGHIIGEKGQTIKGIQSKFGQGTRVSYDKTNKRFIINARTIDLCMKVSEALYHQQEVWKKQRKEYYEKMDEKAHQVDTRRQEQQERRQEQRVEYVKKNPIKLNYKGSIKDHRNEKSKTKTKTQTQTQTQTQKVQKVEFEMNDEAFPTFGNTPKETSCSWNIKSNEEKVPTSEVKTEEKDDDTLATQVKNSKDSNESWYSMDEEDEEKTTKKSRKDQKPSIFEQGNFSQYCSNSDSGIYA